MTPKRAVDSRAAAAACAAMGRLEYVVESARDDTVQTWFVVRPDRELFPRFRRMGMQMRLGCRIVVEAVSLRPLGVLPPDCAPPPSPNGFNPYFDLPPA
jgi:hypothetical protein